MEYAHELMEKEPSGLGSAAVGNLKQAVFRLNSHVHAGRLATSKAAIPPHDDMTEASLRSFASIQRATFANCCVLLAAYRRKKFDGMQALERDHFDWLVGPRLRKEVRRGPFGLGTKLISMVRVAIRVSKAVSSAFIMVLSFTEAEAKP